MRRSAGAEAANYHVVEVSPVDQHSLERCLNEETARGYVFEGLHFVMSEASRRPTMAFVIFRSVSAARPPSRTTRKRPALR